MIRIDGIELATYSGRTLVDPIDLKKAFDSVEPNHKNLEKIFSVFSIRLVILVGFRFQTQSKLKIEFFFQFSSRIYTFQIYIRLYNWVFVQLQIFLGKQYSLVIKILLNKIRDGWPIRSDRIGIVKKKIDLLIAIPLDQSRFSRYLYAS